MYVKSIKIDMKTSEKVSKKLASKIVEPENQNEKSAKDQTIIEVKAKNAGKRKLNPEPDPENEVTPKKRSGLSDYLKELIQEGKFTQKEIMTKGREKFPALAPSTISTLLCDSKNPKYNKFDKLVVLGEKGIMKFSK